MIKRVWVAILAIVGHCVTSFGVPAPAMAIQSQPSLAADDCVFYREDGGGSYLLTNTCEFGIEIAFCAQPKSDASLCLHNQSWMRETLSARGEGKSKIVPDQTIDLFACRMPGSVEILPSGMARCASGPPEPVVPLLLSASLKNPGAIITDKDYPPSEHNKEGTTRFDLMVGPDGKPISCTTTATSGHDVLDQTACNAFLKRARFSPAKDASGAPTTGRYKGSVTWKSP
jgi:TonB family protein